MKNSKTIPMVVGLLCVAIGSTAVGCGQGAPPAVVQASQAQIDNTVKMREIYVRVKGNYDSLSAEDKQAYNGLAGGEAAGQAQWKVMSKNPVGGAGGSPNADPRSQATGSGQ